jgi:hypothetical protein
MAAVYHIDKEARMVFSTGSGAFGYDDAVGHMSRLKADPDFDPSFSQLIDFRELTELTLTHDQIAELSTVEVFLPEARRAFLVSTAEQFGLARVFQAYRSARGDQSIRVYTDPGEAYAWLGFEKHATH